MSNGTVSIYDCGQDERAYQPTAAWFLGPRAENHDFLREAFTLILSVLLQARNEYKPDDPVRSVTNSFYPVLPACAEIYCPQDTEF